MLWILQQVSQQSALTRRDESSNRSFNKITMFIIYALKNTVNSKIYIGQTCGTLKQRWKGGFGYRGCIHIDSAINKYGKDKFYYDALMYCLDQKEANSWEQEYINFYRSTEPKFGFNLRTGGKDNFTYSNYSKKKMSNSHKGKRNPLSEETRNKISIALTGKKASEDSKKKMSASNKNRAGFFKGKHHSESTKLKLSTYRKYENKCEIDNCSNKHRTLGMCKKHYERFRRLRNRLKRLDTH